MSDGYLDPQPFRDWYRKQKERLTPAQIAEQLDVDSRSLRRWDDPKSKIRRTDLEAALEGSEFVLWDIYPEFQPASAERTHGYCTGCKEEVPVDGSLACLWCGRKSWKGRSGVEPRRGSKLTDDQLRSLHKMNQAGATLTELGRRIWRATGYASEASAIEAIRLGFRRLGLQTVKRRSVLNRCAGVKTQWPGRGEPCGKTPASGSRYCPQHDPEKRGLVIAQMRRAYEIQKAQVAA
jgi:hypothetical protein